MDGAEIVRGLIARGYDPVKAAAIGGHILQESGGNPSSVNRDEDAHGLLQWRGGRWVGLQEAAKARGTVPTDPELQLDYIKQEMAGPEAKAGALFNAANDLPSASAALKKYIRFGDNSDAVRLKNAQGLLGIPQAGMIPTSPASTMAAASPSASPAGAGIAASAPAASPADDSGLMEQLAAIPKLLQAQQANQQYAPAPPIPDNLRARIAAIAAARQLGQPT